MMVEMSHLRIQPFCLKERRFWVLPLLVQICTISVFVVVAASSSLGGQPLGDKPDCTKHGSQVVEMKLAIGTVLEVSSVW